MRRRSSAVTALALAVLITTTACSEDRPDRAVTVEPQDSGTTSAGSGEDSEADAAQRGDGIGDPLTQRQIDDALLRVHDMPSGWAQQKDEDEDEDEDAIEPARCEDVIDALDGAMSEPMHEGEVTFNNGGPFGMNFNQSIATYEDEITADVAQQAADAFGACPEFTSTDAEGTETTFTVSPMSFPNLGDQTLAFAMTISSDGFEFTANLAAVYVGHNAVGFFSAGIAGMSGSDFEKLARSGMKRLENVAAS